MNITLQQLEAFALAARRNSFTCAGEELYLTQAAFSSRIITLEKELGVTLFSRCRRGQGKGVEIKITDEGAKLLPHAEKLIDELNNIRIKFGGRGEY